MAEQAELTRPQRRRTSCRPSTPRPASRASPTIRTRSMTREAAAKAARAAFLDWRRTSFDERSAVIHKAAEILRAREIEFARLMTEEMGKTLDDGRAEVEKCAFHCDWFADHAAEYLAQRAGRHRRRRSLRHLQPARDRPGGDAVEFPVLAGVPLRRAGADGRQRHAAEARQQRAGLRARDRGGASPGRRSQGPVPHPAAAEQRRRGADQGRQCRRRHPDRQRPGRQSVATAAGSVLKKCVLELGGSDAYVVLEDADIEAAAKIAATARMVNGGQSCIAGKRFIVVRSIVEPFEQALVEAMRGYRDGRPDEGRDQARADAERQGPRRDPQAGRGEHRQGRAAAARRQGPRPAGRLVSGDGAQPTFGRASRRMTRRCSARSPRSSPPRTKPTRSASPTTASSASARAC